MGLIMSRNKVRVSCNTVGFRALSVQQAFKNIADAGYKYVEVEATNPFCMHVVGDNDDPEDFKRSVVDFGFKGATALWSTHGAIIPDPLRVEYVAKCIRWAKAADIPVVHAAMALIKDSRKYMIDALEELGVDYE